MTPRAKEALEKAVSLAFSDSTWQHHGFPKRPVHGSVVNKLFRPKWRVALETALFADIVITSIAAHVAGGQLGSDDLLDLALFFTTDPSIANIIGFDSVGQFEEAVLEYADATPDQWSGIQAGKLDIESVAAHDRELAAKLTVACAFLPRVAATLIEQARQNTQWRG